MGVLHQTVKWLVKPYIAKRMADMEREKFLENKVQILFYFFYQRTGGLFRVVPDFVGHRCQKA
jgi:hypothetical protein